MKERNRKTLQQALQNLSERQAPEETWRAIEEQLNQGEHQPLFPAPAGIWERIERRLNRRQRLHQLRPWLAAAAVAILLLSTALLWGPASQDPGALPSTRLSEKQAEESPDLTPAEDLSQAIPWPSCLSEADTLEGEMREDWQALRTTYQAHQQASSPSSQDSLRQQYLDQRGAFVRKYCE